MSIQARHHLFLVGPASVGKSTVGRSLANRFRLPLVDVDDEFNARIGDTTIYLTIHGYEAYARTNSTLVQSLVASAKHPSVFVLPGGFLVHESVPDLVPKHLDLLKKHGLTILILPARTAGEAVDVVVARQLARPRWGNDTADVERERFLRRFDLYIKHGDIQIFSSESPEAITSTIESELHRLHPNWFNSI